MTDVAAINIRVVSISRYLGFMFRASALTIHMVENKYSRKRKIKKQNQIQDVFMFYILFCMMPIFSVNTEHWLVDFTN